MALPWGKVCEVNDEKWYKDDCHIPVNGIVPPKAWSVNNSLGEVLVADCDKVAKRYTRLQVFMMMMPPKALRDMLSNTNEQLLNAGLKELTRGELFCILGLMILMSRFEFQSRHSLWSRVSPSRYIPAANFSRTGMTRHQFDDIFRHWRTGHQPAI